MLTKEQRHEQIAKRVAQELSDGSLVNLGIGLPTKVQNYIPANLSVIIQSENGFVGLGPTPDPIDPTIVNASGQPASIKQGGAYFDITTSFGIIRGGHVDISVLGGLQVDETGNLANYLIPGVFVPGIGSAMDLLAGVKKVIVAMEHTNYGKPKILKQCTLPLTARGRVNQIITEMGVFEITQQGIEITEIASGYTFDEIQAVTAAQLINHLT